MIPFKKYNNIVGWAIGIISLLVYAATAEPTASFWDCGEFIAVSYKLEVPHPPGAPLFLLIGRIFSFFAFGNPEKVAFWINMSSAASSALTNVFLFWTITLLARKLMKTDKEYTLTQQIIILGAGAVGALANAFSDSFWFSAVEAEVYALSSLSTAVAFWMILKWEEAVTLGNKQADKWILLLAYTMGLSIGVHLLNLLTIPAIGMIYYFKRYKFSWTGVLMCFGVSMIILLFIQYGIIPGLPSLALKLDLMFVNSIGLPFNSGAIFLMLVIITGIFFGLKYAHKKANHTLILGIISFTLILVGYASYAPILIRSNDNTNIDENNPEDLPRFISYLKREQYGDRPLFRGGSFDSHGNGEEDLSANYEEGDSVYFVDKKRNRYTGFDVRPVKKWAAPVTFPRRHSEQPAHIEKYKQYNSNMAYFINYQVGHMYWRYFMWNFVGRGSDEQDSSWEDGLFRRTTTDNKANNHYYFLPFLIGLIGLFYQGTSSKKDAGIVGVLFFLTGIAIVIYLNQTPFQPRERDYSYVGSFYAFCIWVGLGVIGLFEWLRSLSKNNEKPIAIATVAISLLAAPILMLAQNWNDHDRSGRYFCPDSARNILESCDENAILVTNGDNDTFPLWYLQEVEGVRTDVRVVNLSLLRTDWYAWQLKHLKNGKADALPITYNDEDFMGERMAYESFRSSIINLPVDKEKIRKQLSSDVKDEQILSPFPWTVTARSANKEGAGHLIKDDLMLLNIIQNNASQGWKRPIYVSMTVPIEGILTSMQPYFQLEGMTYKFVPVKNKDNSGRVDIERTTERLNKKFRFRGLDNDKLYFEEQAQHMVSNYRNIYYRLATAYVEKGDKAKAKEVLNQSMKLMPEKTVVLDAFAMLSNAEVYDKCDDKVTADQNRKRSEDICKKALDVYPPESADYKRHKSILAYMIGVYGTAGNANKALEISQYLYTKTGEPEYQQYVNMIKANPNFFKPEPIEQDSTLKKDSMKIEPKPKDKKTDKKK